MRIHLCFALYLTICQAVFSPKYFSPQMSSWPEWLSMFSNSLSDGCVAPELCVAQPSKFGWRNGEGCTGLRAAGDSSMKDQKSRTAAARVERPEVTARTSSLTAGAEAPAS